MGGAEVCTEVFRKNGAGKETACDGNYSIFLLEFIYTSLGSDVSEPSLVIIM